MKKTIVFIIIAILVIAMGIIVGIKLKPEKTEQVSSDNVGNKEQINQTENMVDVITKNEISNDEISNTDTDLNNTVDEEEKEPKTDLEKAIYIVKKDWGQDDTVYFAEDGQTADGEYIICVRDKNTTNALLWYTVNIETGEFEKE